MQQGKETSRSEVQRGYLRTSRPGKQIVSNSKVALPQRPPKRAPARRKPMELKWPLLLALNVVLLFVLAIPVSPLEGLTWLSADESTPRPETYSLHVAGQSELPTGIGELRVLGKTAFATTSVRWNSLKRPEKESTLKELIRRFAPAGQVIAFHRTGKPAGYGRAGRTEVYP